MGSTKTATSFLSLPRELRDQIYDDYICTFQDDEEPNNVHELEDGVIVGSSVPPIMADTFRDKVMTIGKTCPQINAEFLSIFWGSKRKIPIYFHSVEDAQAFISDDELCPAEYRDGVTGVCWAEDFERDDEDPWSRQLYHKLYRWLEDTCPSWKIGCAPGNMDEGPEFPMPLVMFEGLAINGNTKCEDMEIKFYPVRFDKELGAQVDILAGDWGINVWFPLAENICIAGDIGRLGVLRGEGPIWTDQDSVPEALGGGNEDIYDQGEDQDDGHDDMLSKDDHVQN